MAILGCSKASCCTKVGVESIAFITILASKNKQIIFQKMNTLAEIIFFTKEGKVINMSVYYFYYYYRNLFICICIEKSKERKAKNTKKTRPFFIYIRILDSVDYVKIHYSFFFFFSISTQISN